jgi:hypothetical protein
LVRLPYLKVPQKTGCEVVDWSGYGSHRLLPLTVGGHPEINGTPINKPHYIAEAFTEYFQSILAPALSFY